VTVSCDYEFLKKLRPLKEMWPEKDPGWYKIQWRPIKNGMYNLYITTKGFFLGKHFIYRGMGFGIRTWPQGVHSGWNRSWKSFHIELNFLFWTLNFWIMWNIIVHKDGPSDWHEKVPLDLSKLVRKEKK